MQYQYLESEVDWIGKTPKHWRKDKIFRVSDLISSGGTPQSANESYYEGNIYWVQSGDLNDGYINDSEKKITPEAIANSSAKIFPKNTLLVAMYGATIGKLGILNMDAATNQACCAIQPSGKISGKFLFYIFVAMKDRLISSAYGGGQPNISQSIIKQSYFYYPSFKSEQISITNFLDEACKNIEAAIEIKRTQILKLKAYRDSLVHETLTKGLNKNTALKSSGIKWLGEVPSHWSVVRIKDVANLQSGNSITSESITEVDEYPVYGGNGLRGYTTSYTHEGFYALIGRQGALCGNINYAEGKFWASEHAVVITILKKCETIWLGELLKIMNLNQYSNAAAQPGLAVEKIRNLYIPLPPRDEQKEISTFLTNFSRQNEATIAIIKEQIETLYRYKKILVYEVVTGMKQVYDLK